jgi:hypothetical protein
MTKANQTIWMSVFLLMASNATALDIKAPTIEEVLIIGSKEDKSKLAGSGIQIGQELIEKQGLH